MAIRRAIVMGFVLAGWSLSGWMGCREAPQVEESDQSQTQASAKQPETDESSSEPPEALQGPTGLVTVETGRPVSSVVDTLRDSIASNDKLTLSTTLDHAANATSADLSLPATMLVVVAHPHQETPIINKSRLAALASPLKVLVWKASDRTKVAFNAPAYVGARYAVERGKLFLGSIEETLVDMVESATGETIEHVHERDHIELDPFEGIIKKESDNSVSDTFEKLQSLIKDQEGLSVIATVDLSAHADAVDRSLRPTRLLMFGNPEAGTPLMRAKRTIGIDLPQKFLVYEGEKGGIFLAYNNPYYLAERHGLEGHDEQLKAIKTLLEDLAAEGTKEITP